MMTCDIEMPKMNGIEFVRRLYRNILAGDYGHFSEGVVFDVLKAGAVDFVAKPDVNSLKDVRICL